MGEALEVAKTLVSPAEKLIGAIQGAIGKAYEPRHIKKLAAAKAYEIATIGEALRENSDIPIIYDKGAIAIDTTDFDAFAKRTQSRLAFQELTKQKNIESVIDVAYSELDGQADVADEPVDQDWIIRFFNSAGDISNEQMQWIWGKLLAGEIKHPGAFSLRTLNILKTLTQNEAIIFKEIAPFVLRCKGDESDSYDDFFLINDKKNSLQTKYNIPFAKIMKLSEAGLISENSAINIAFDVGPNKIELIKGINKAIELKNMGTGTLGVCHSAYFLTEAGKELFSIIIEDNNNTALPNEYLADCLEEVKIYGISFVGESAEIHRISIKIVDYL